MLVSLEELTTMIENILIKIKILKERRVKILILGLAFKGSPETSE